MGEKSSLCVEGKFNDPSLRNCYSLLFLPAAGLSMFWLIDGLFEKQGMSRALKLSCALLPDL